jgi:Sec-independent protein secretion pathway component TatC
MKAARPDDCKRESMTNIANLIRITALVAVFVSIPLTLRAIGDYVSPEFTGNERSSKCHI